LIKKIANVRLFEDIEVNILNAVIDSNFAGDKALPAIIAHYKV